MRKLVRRSNFISEKIPVFRSPESEAQYQAAYAAMLNRWLIPYEELFIPTGFGDTHVIASGVKDAPSLVLFHSAGSGACQWFRNVGSPSQHYRTIAVDVIVEVNKSVTTRRLMNCLDCAEWVTEWRSR